VAREKERGGREDVVIVRDIPLFLQSLFPSPLSSASFASDTAFNNLSHSVLASSLHCSLASTNARPLAQVLTPASFQVLMRYVRHALKQFEIVFKGFLCIDLEA
jgi:hypothetical protein